MKPLAKTRLEEITEELKEMAPQIDNDVRMQWAVDNGCSLKTVERYLSGSAKMLIVAEKLLSDMKKVIKKSIAA